MKWFHDTLNRLACHDVELANPTPAQQKLLDDGWIRYHRADGFKGWHRPVEKPKEASNG